MIENFASPNRIYIEAQVTVRGASLFLFFKNARRKNYLSLLNQEQCNHMIHHFSILSNNSIELRSIQSVDSSFLAKLQHHKLIRIKVNCGFFESLVC